MAGIATVTSPMGTASNCAARSLGEDSTSPSAGIHLYTLLLFFPSAGVHLRGTRWGRGWRGVAVRRDFGHPSFRFVSWTSGSWMPGVGSIGVIWWMTHFFSQCLTRPSRICACVRAASRWPRVDIVHSPSEVSKPKNSSPKTLARAFCYRGRKASRTTSEPARRRRGRNGAAERRRSRAGSKSPPCAPRWLPRWAPPAPRAPATGEGGAGRSRIIPHAFGGRRAPGAVSAPRIAPHRATTCSR